MKASKENPSYSAYLIIGNKKYNITPAIISISMADQERQMAKSVTLTIMNVRIGNLWLVPQIEVRQRVFIYANDGEKNEEVFRGWVWNRYYQEATDERELTMKCYDNLIYFQESEDSLYFSDGQNTKNVMQSICKKWGINLDYSYSTITHSKLVLRGTLSDIFTSDILDKVKERTGKKYVISSAKDTMYVKAIGQNKTIYNIAGKQNAIATRRRQTMDGMITKVVILGKAEDDGDKLPVVATVSGNTSKYGTLQKLQNKDEDTSLADAKQEAQATINASGSPKLEFEVKATDIPWIQKGDLVHVDTAGISEDLIVLSIDRTIANQKAEMNLTLERPPAAAASSSASELTVDGVVGTDTIKAMQKWLGTTQDGVITGQTTNCRPYIPAMAAHCTWTGTGSPCITALQSFLNSKSYGAGAEDGLCGPITVRALQKFLNDQANASLDIDGTLEAETAKALQKYLNTL